MTAFSTTTLALHGGPKAMKRPWPARGLLGAEEKAAVMALFDQAIASGNAIGYQGAEEEAYCREFAQSLGGGFADGVNAGSTAVYVALRALEPPAGSEVIVSPITDPGGIMPIHIAGCVPVPADAAPGSFNTGAEQIAQRITSRTRAILVAHIAGSPCDMKPIMELAARHNLKVIEDCAQAHGALYHDQPVGTLGDVSAFSTMFGKHHCTGGQGGVVFTRDQDLYWKIRRYADRGKAFNLPGQTGNVVASLNLNMDEIHAAIGRVQLRKLPAIVARRRASRDRLLELAAQRLRAVQFIGDPAWGKSSVWFIFLKLNLDMIRVSKDEFAKAVEAEGVLWSSTYTPAVIEHPWMAQAGLNQGPDGMPWALPNLRAAESCTSRIFWHESMEEVDILGVVEAIEKVEQAYLK